MLIIKSFIFRVISVETPTEKTIAGRGQTFLNKDERVCYIDAEPNQFLLYVFILSIND